MAATQRIDVIRDRLDRAVEMRWLRESMRELSEAAHPPPEEPGSGGEESGSYPGAAPAERPRP
ncbi:MAG TPA: hypothetical protein VGJ32_00560 [Solirubrobacteraceae bacterium]